MFQVAEAREEDLSDVVQMNFIEIAGRDRLGRHIVLITAANIKVHWHALITYFVSDYELKQLF
jgi:hypothetical protein